MSVFFEKTKKTVGLRRALMSLCLGEPDLPPWVLGCLVNRTPVLSLPALQHLNHDRNTTPLCFPLCNLILFKENGRTTPPTW